MRPSRNECPSYLKWGFKKRGLGEPEEVACLCGSVCRDVGFLATKDLTRDWRVRVLAEIILWVQGCAPNQLCLVHKPASSVIGTRE